MEGTYNSHLVQVPTVFFYRNIKVAEKKIHMKVTHTVLLAVISMGKQTAAKIRSETTGRGSKKQLLTLK